MSDNETNNIYSDLNNISIDKLIEEKYRMRISILKLFLDDETIKFILKNNKNFINRISINSLKKSAKFFMENNEYAYLIKWYPILLDYDRFITIFKYLKMNKLDNKKIKENIEKSIYKDFEYADLLNEKNVYINQNDDIEVVRNFYKYLNYEQQISKSRINNEVFNNLLDNNIVEYSNLLRRLK